MYPKYLEECATLSRRWKHICRTTIPAPMEFTVRELSERGSQMNRTLQTALSARSQDCSFAPSMSAGPRLASLLPL